MQNDRREHQRRRVAAHERAEATRRQGESLDHLPLISPGLRARHQSGSPSGAATPPHAATPTTPRWRTSPTAMRSAIRTSRLPTTTEYPLTDGALALAHSVEAAPVPPAITALVPAERQETGALVAEQHILIVEDDSRIADVIRTALELEGEPTWAVHVAREGGRALDVAGATPPQVVLLDVGLPGLDGAEVYRRLRANPRTQDARVLFLTAATSLDLHQQGIEGGVLMRKPFDVQEVVSLVRALLVR